jgi:hypothetical protein
VTTPGQTSCPHCGQVYTVQPWQIGQRFACTRCSKEFIAGAVPLAPPTPVPFAMPVAMQPQSSNGFATAGMILGIFFCVPLASILALIFGIIGLNKTNDPNVGGKGQAVAGIVLGSVGLLLMLSIIIPVLSRAREIANRVECAQNLRQIERAIVTYTNNNNGSYPPDLGTLYKDQQLDLHLFCCPDTNTSPPPNMSVDQAAQWVNQNSDYIYLGAGLTSPAPANTLVIYEKDQDHAPAGNNILYGDGRVVFLPTAKVHQLIAQSNTSGSGQ